MVDSIEKLIKMHCDNFIVVFFSNHLKNLHRAKYINVKFYKVEEKNAKGLITIKHTPTHNMMVDLLTKGLPIGMFEEHVSCMRLQSS